MRGEPLRPCQSCGLPIYVGPPTARNRGRGRECHTCSLFGLDDGYNERNEDKWTSDRRGSTEIPTRDGSRL